MEVLGVKAELLKKDGPPTVSAAPFLLLTRAIVA
ncbi:Uncharacterised protein [Mycobacterium tuberculosis]|nr:Uncharacterised protein [Mycobacterium tuberculosis]